VGEKDRKVVRVSVPDLSRAQWRKSSYSSGNGQCVEVAVTWRKSSYSSANGACVEVAGAGTVVAVRDSKDRQGPALVFSAAAWQDFTAMVKIGKFDLG
jgi:hypothetical protein